MNANPGPAASQVLEHRMENELTAVAARRLYVHRIRLDAACFSSRYQCDLWAGKRTHSILAVVHFGGVSLFINERAAHPRLAHCFGFEHILSWQARNDVVVLHVLVDLRVLRAAAVLAGEEQTELGASEKTADMKWMAGATEGTCRHAKLHLRCGKLIAPPSPWKTRHEPPRLWSLGSWPKQLQAAAR